MDMKVLTLDFETFFSREYSLRKMSPVEYILDPRFQCTGLAVKRGDAPAEWVHGEDVEEFFRNEPTDVMCLSHNALFDMSICAWRYGWVPKLMVDTLGIARAILAKELKHLSLDKVGEHLGIGRKTGVLSTVLGMRREDIQARPDLYASFQDYGKNDVDICYGIFEKLVLTGEFPMQELVVMDMVLRCTVQPQFIVDVDLLRQRLAEIQKEKEETLSKAMLAGADGKTVLMSNPQFAELLRAHGVEPPMKTSPLTGKTTFAFAKTDQAFNDLLEHPNPAVQALVAARLDHKSTIEETRHERFINIASLEWPEVSGPTPVTSKGYRRLMPMPLKYSGAHTHRLSGDFKLNVQNLGRGSILRKALCAPEGYVVVAGDESQVEARITCTLAGQEDMRQQFENGEDVYSIFATALFGREISKKDKIERFIGKTCLAGDTKVLTNEGWVPILYLKDEHKLWDGMEWVSHSGLVNQGKRPVIRKHGLGMTGDHEILTEHGWREWREVLTNPSLIRSALSLVNLPLSTGNVAPIQVTGRDGTLSAGAVAAQSQGHTVTTSLKGERRGAMLVQRLRRALNAIGNINRLWKTTNIELAFSTGYPLQFPGATTRGIEHTSTTESGELQCIRGGGRIGPASSGTFRPLKGGITRISRWIVSTLMPVTLRVTSGSFQGQITSTTNGRYPTSKLKSESLENVYDIANAGPRHRFTVLSDRGPIIVHNCILGLGYGLGKDKFTESIPVLAWNQMGINLPYTPEEGAAAVGLYRSKNFHIANSWKLLGANGIRALIGGGDWQWGPVLFRKEEIVLPNGMKLYYHNLRQEQTETGHEWVFDYGGMKKRIYGGKLLENIVQALARIIVMDAAVQVQKHLLKLGIRLALQVHDELVFVVKQEHEKVTRFVLEHELKRRPKWLPNLPLDCEIASGPTYGDAK